MEMSEIYNGSQWAHNIFLVNKAGATEYIMDRSSTLIIYHFDIAVSPACFTGMQISYSTNYFVIYVSKKIFVTDMKNRSIW